MKVLWNSSLRFCAAVVLSLPRGSTSATSTSVSISVIPYPVAAVMSTTSTTIVVAFSADHNWMREITLPLGSSTTSSPRAALLAMARTTIAVVAATMIAPLAILNTQNVNPSISPAADISAATNKSIPANKPPTTAAAEIFANENSLQERVGPGSPASGSPLNSSRWMKNHATAPAVPAMASVIKSVDMPASRAATSEASVGCFSHSSQSKLMPVTV